MASIGDQLRQAREAQGLSVAEVVDQTKLMTDQIHALEAGDWGAFAAPVYMRGFVRNYAGLLKLDVEGVMKGLEAELGQVKPDVIGEDGEAPLRAGLLDGVMLHFSGVKWKAVIPVFWSLVWRLAFIWGVKNGVNTKATILLKLWVPG